MRILLAEDEIDMARLIAKGLREESYAVDVAKDGEEALYQAEINRYDMAILDIMLPLRDGFTVCRELRKKKFWSPILVLSARTAIEDKVTGLNCGADDYLSKPFDLRELLARLRALTRRASQVRPDVLQVGDLTLNTLNHTANRAGKLISLTAKEYALLELFMLKAGQILGRDEIAEHVWDENFDAFSNLIEAYVKRLRKKIDKGFDHPLIHTRRLEGYMLSVDFGD